MRVSVICTVLNEGDSVRRLLDSLVSQVRPPDEVVIVDGGSRDNTVAVVREYEGRLPLRLLVQPGANISQGRNAAIRAATGDVIASTDAGVWLDPNWLHDLAATLAGLGPAEFRAAAGFFIPAPQTVFEIAMGATVLPDLADVDPQRFLPSSRSVAFTKAAWEKVAGYPEWLDYCEDLIFDIRLSDLTGGFGWAPSAVAHFRPRGTLRAFVKQYYRYARGDGKADLWRRRHAIRYVTYLVIFPLLLLLGAQRSPWWLLGLLGGAAVYCRTPYRRLKPQTASLAPRERLLAFALVPLIRVAGDVAKMMGYPVGWLWRLRNWSRAEIHWNNPRSR